MKPRPLSVVRFIGPDINLYPNEFKDDLIFMGEIPNMPEHCIVISLKDKQLFIGYHTENFTEIQKQ